MSNKAPLTADEIAALQAVMNMVYGNQQVISKKRKVKIVRSYEYQKSMLYAIQAITGEQTHDIIANLVSEADKHVEASGLDLALSPYENAKSSGSHSWSNERRLKKYMFYPGTGLYIGIYVLYSDYGRNSRGFVFDLKYNFKLPITSMKMDQKEYDDYITDGILCDASKDIDRPNMKSSLTKEERKIKELQAKAKREHKAAQKKLAKKKKPPNRIDDCLTRRNK